MKTSGLNFSQKAKLKNLMAQGYTAAEISSMLGAAEKSVASWMEFYSDDIEVDVVPEDENDEDD